MSPWTDEEILALVRLWPTQSTMQIANTLHRSHSAIRRKAAALRSEGLLESKNAPRVRSIKPDPRDFDDVKRDYCRKHRIDIAELDARLERDDQLAAKLYRQAQAAEPTRLRSRPVGRLGTGSSPLSAPGGADALPQHLHPDLLGFGATRRLLEVAG